MARAAVLPPSPVKRGTRKAPRTNVTKATTASSRAKAATDTKKRAPVKTAVYDSDDTEDELGMMMKQDDEKPTRPRSRIAGRPAAKPTTTRAKKPMPAPAPATQLKEEDEASKVELTKKRVGRPKKNPEPSAPNPETAPKTRGRPRVATTAKTTKSRNNTGDATEDDVNPRHIVIATNSTTIRSNLLRGPAKKKTVTFHNVSGSEVEDIEESVPPVAGRKRATSNGASKTGLRATPVRKPAVAAGRGRKSVANKETAKPLSPKKAKQMAKTLSAYASSDDEDELCALKDDVNPVKLVVHSPVKQEGENTGLSSPVRRINFTPKKSSSMVDENGEPKLPTPKHGSTGTGLSSPVRKINFTPNRTQHAVADNGHLALPPGKAIDFSDSVFMSSPARRPEASPFKFSLRNEHSVSAPDPSQNITSPLKMSPKKGHLGASFSQSPSKASTTSPSFPARSSLFQSPAKKIASPFKSSLFSSKQPMNEMGTPNRKAPVISGSSLRSDRKFSPSKSVEDDEIHADQDLEMVQEVARDIFGIELDSDSRTPSQSPSPIEISEPQIEQELGLTELLVHDTTLQNEDDADIDEKIADLQEEIRREPDDFGTVCLNTMEELQESFKNLPEQEDIESEDDVGFITEERDEPESLGDDDGQESQAEADSDFDSPLAEDEYPVEEPQVGEVDHHMDDECDLSSDITLEFQALEEARTPLSVHEALKNEDEETFENRMDEEFAGSIRHLDEEQEVETDNEMHDDEHAFAPTKATLSSQPRSPYELHRAEVSPSSSDRMRFIPPLAPTPPATRATPLSHTKSATSIDRLFDINVDLRFDFEASSFDSTQNRIPTPPAPRFSDTPSAEPRRKSNFNADLGFTPLARKFDNWEAKTPSSNQPARPRRRGVFSLVGPLEPPAEPNTPEAGDVSYPDLSHNPLATTPSLFAELPLQGQSDDTCMVPESPAKSSVAGEDHYMVDSPHGGDIFEDPQPEESDLVHSHENINVLQPVEDKEPEEEEDGKENYDVSFVPPATPVKGGPSPLRTVHTVSKVPLKREGDISPLKVPRKRGLSLSNTSPTRTSPRIRKSMFFPRMDSPPVLSPTRQSSQVDRSPTPKRRCSSPRRSSAKIPAMAPPKSPSVAGSPVKAPRRSASPTKQTLRGAVVHVDVHTTEGEDASGIFVELLQQMGARCVKFWSWNPRMSLSPVDGEDPTQSSVGITHVVYKDGGLRTLEKVKQASGMVKCVGVGWVLE